MLTAKVLEIDPTVPVLVFTTVPSITSCTWEADLMHSMWCQAPLFRPEPPVALRLAVPRKTQVIAPDCSRSIFYSVESNVPLRTRS